MNSLGNLVLRHVAREEIVAVTEYRSLQYDWAVYTILLCLHPLVCLCNWTYHKLVKAGQVYENEFESVSYRDCPYEEDCPQLSKRQAPRKQLST